MNLLCGVMLCLSLSVSGYSDSTGAPPFAGLTASGAKTAPGVAACGPSFPFGTVMLVGGKPYVCLDRGSAITDGKLDLWMESEAAALTWGRRQLPVVVIR